MKPNRKSEIRNAHIIGQIFRHRRSGAYVLVVDLSQSMSPTWPPGVVIVGYLLADRKRTVTWPHFVRTYEHIRPRLIVTALETWVPRDEVDE